MQNALINVAYLVASVLFIFGLIRLAHPRTAVRGNFVGAIGMLIAIVATLFDRHIVDDGFTGHPEITVTRLTEENDVVVAEGRVRAQRTDGSYVNLEFCDVFELQDLPALLLQQQGITTRKVPHSIIARAGAATGADGQSLGQVNRGDDERLRQFWRYWREYMGLRQDVPIAAGA